MAENKCGHCEHFETIRKCKKQIAIKEWANHTMMSMEYGRADNNQCKDYKRDKAVFPLLEDFEK